MSPEERLAFEEELSRSDSLSAELEEARAILELAGEWLDEPVPGAERVEEIPIPQVSVSPAPVYTINSAAKWILRAAAVLLVFLSGYLTRGAVDTQEVEDVAKAPVENNSSNETEPEEAESPKAPDTGPSRVVASADSFQRVTDNNGELIIETQRSYWVVKPDMELNSIEPLSEKR